MSGPYKILDDEIFIRFDQGTYHVRVSKEIVPSSDRPVSCLYGRIWTMIDPDDVILTSEYARFYPLDLATVKLNCSGGKGEPLKFDFINYTGNQIEFRIYLKGGSAADPQYLYPGATEKVMYSYEITDRQWGPFCERRMVRETSSFRIQLDFPADSMEVTGSLISGQLRQALQPPIAYVRQNNRDLWTWSTAKPVWEDRYRLNWKFKDRRDLELLTDFRTFLRRNIEKESILRINEKDCIVTWNGQDYPVSATQLICIRTLHKNQLEGHQMMHQRNVLSSIQGDAQRLRDLFKKSKLYNTLIKPQGRGYFSLDLDPK